MINPFFSTSSFINIFNPSSSFYLFQAFSLLKQFNNFLFDDFSPFKSNFNYFSFLSLINSLEGHFWIIIEPSSKEFAGFFFLDDFIGNPFPSSSSSSFTPSNNNIYHSASINACISKKFWGPFVYKQGKLIINLIFKHFNLHKLQAQVFSHNHRPINILQKLGFSKEATLIHHTVVDDKFCDLLVFSIVNN